MARAGSRWVTLITVTGMAVVFCGALMIMMNFATVEIKKRAGEMPPVKSNEPAGPFAERIKQLTHKEFAVTQRGQDDAASFGRYVENKDPGLYLDVVSGEVLFTSLDKLDPAAGFAEFSGAFNPSLLIEQEAVVSGETKLLVKSKTAQSYLGWITTDENGARRYIINSSALRFIPGAELEKNDLGQHRTLFPTP